MNQELINQLYETNVETNYQLKAVRGNHKRIYQFKDYNVLQKTYTYLLENGRTLTISMY